jgi:hypothetical protein
MGSLCLEDDSVTFRPAIYIGIFKGGVEPNLIKVMLSKHTMK